MTPDGPTTRALESAAAARGVTRRPGAQAAGLATSQLRRLRRIVDVAVRLAEQGGFEAVRLRDVAEASDVSLGTLYRYFRSKEDILLFALNEDVGRAEKLLARFPLAGAGPLERVTEFFEGATREFARRPQLAHAVLRSIAAGDEALAAQVAGFYLRMKRLVVMALRGGLLDESIPIFAENDHSREQDIAFVLLNVWFASLAAWAGGLHELSTVSDHLRTTARLLLGEA